MISANTVGQLIQSYLRSADCNVLLWQITKYKVLKTKHELQFTKTQNSDYNTKEKHKRKVQNTKYKIQNTDTVAAGSRSGDCNALGRPHRLFGKQAVARCKKFNGKL